MSEVMVLHKELCSFSVKKKKNFYEVSVQEGGWGGGGGVWGGLDLKSLLGIK